MPRATVRSAAELVDEDKWDPRRKMNSVPGVAPWLWPVHGAVGLAVAIGSVIACVLFGPADAFLLLPAAFMLALAFIEYRVGHPRAR